jgi:hypothetical protein
LRGIIESQLRIVPSNVRLTKRNDGSEYFLEWDNHLQAMHNVKNYELDLGGEDQVYNVKAPHRRVVIENPIDGQKVSTTLVNCIHCLDSSTSNPEGRENIR